LKKIKVIYSAAKFQELYEQIVQSKPKLQGETSNKNIWFMEKNISTQGNKKKTVLTSGSSKKAHMCSGSASVRELQNGKPRGN